MTPADMHVTTSSPGSATSEAQLSRILVAVIIASVATRLLIASLVGLTYDETILVVKAHHLNLSYFDHPPLASLLMAAMRWLTGSEDALVLRLPTIGLCAGTTWLIFRTGAMFVQPAGRLLRRACARTFPILRILFGHPCPH
jgi:4-amino-4-deoxy-L-arabinose transferase-like glycosyltransferase